MLDELTKYKQSDHFFFKPGDTLSEVCNAPTDKSGIYIVYALKAGRIELVYIGRSGEIKSDGTVLIGKAGLGGLKDSLVNGKQFGEARRKAWKTIMSYEKIEALDIYWYVTHDVDCNDCPKMLEKILLQKYIDIYGGLPKWNNEL